VRSIIESHLFGFVGYNRQETRVYKVAFATGRRIGPYEVKSPLGEDGMPI